MKIRFCFLSFFILAAAITSAAQKVGHMSGDTRDRIEAQRVAYITQQMRLTPDEAARFWPVYNAYRDDLKSIREDFERPDLENITEMEAGSLLEQHLHKEQRKLDLKKTLLAKLKEVVSAKKILLLQRAEMEFNRELLRKVQENRKP